MHSLLLSITDVISSEVIPLLTSVGFPQKTDAVGECTFKEIGLDLLDTFYHMGFLDVTPLDMGLPDEPFGYVGHAISEALSDYYRTDVYDLLGPYLRTVIRWDDAAIRFSDIASLISGMSRGEIHLHSNSPVSAEVAVPKLMASRYLGFWNLTTCGCGDDDGYWSDFVSIVRKGIVNPTNNTPRIQHSLSRRLIRHILLLRQRGIVEESITADVSMTLVTYYLVLMRSKIIRLGISDPKAHVLSEYLLGIAQLILESCRDQTTVNAT